MNSIIFWEEWAEKRFKFAETAGLLNAEYFRAEIKEARNDYYLGKRVAKSLRLEEETGEVHCVCCLTPQRICQKLKKQGYYESC